MNATMKNDLTYQIEAGQWGDVLLFYRGQTMPIASAMKTWAIRMDPESLQRMSDWVGFNMWRWLGIRPDRLPSGLTMEDIKTAYLIARDEVLEMGDCVAE